VRTVRRGPEPGKVPIPGRWADRGACRGWPTEWWYPGGEVYPARSAKQQKIDAEVARWICASLCPVTAQCLAHARRYREIGIWGGLDEHQRKRERRRRVA